MFDYLGVLISVIFGLALTHLLTWLSRIIQMRGHVRVYWVHIVWTLNIVVYILALWWGMYWLKNLHDWTIERFLFLAAYASIVYLLSALLFPHEVAEGFDFEAHFEKNRRWFFGFFVLAMLLDVPETLSKQSLHLRDTPVQYLFFLPAMLVFGLAGWLAKDRRVHGAVVLLVFFSFLAYVSFTSLEKIIINP